MGTFWDSSATDYTTGILKVMLHEIGHTMGLNDEPVPNLNASCGGQTAGISVMNGKCGINDRGNNLPTDVTSCDDQTVGSNSYYQTGGCPINCEYQPDAYCGPVDHCLFPDNGCPPNCTSNGSCCFNPTPIIIDVSGNGFNLTDVENGVYFDIGGDGYPDHVSWIASGSDNAWLVLDRNNNSKIDNGTELFGNATPQPHTLHANGFTALAAYDKPENGGNGERSRRPLREVKTAPAMTRISDTEA